MLQNSHFITATGEYKHTIVSIPLSYRSGLHQGISYFFFNMNIAILFLSSLLYSGIEGHMRFVCPRPESDNTGIKEVLYILLCIVITGRKLRVPLGHGGN